MRAWLRRRPAPLPPDASPPEAPPQQPPAAATDPVPMSMTLEARIEMATAARDCDDLPKVAGAGTIVTAADGSRAQVMHNGILVQADGYCGEWMTRLIARCRGHHEPQEERAFAEIIARLPADASMIELGGWWAFYTLWFLKDRPARRAWVVEPDPIHRRVGEANARLNGASFPFIDGFIGGSPAPPSPFRTEEGQDLLLPRLAVPQLMRDCGLGSLDLLHCDAQGAELDVVASCADLFRQGLIRTVVVSTHHWSISGDPLTHQSCLALLRDCGGRVLAEHDVHESFSGDGLIVARFGADADAWQPIALSHNRYSTSLFRNPLYDLAAERANR